MKIRLFLKLSKLFLQSLFFFQAEYEKRYFAELYQPLVATSPPPFAMHGEMQRMCLQVKDVLPLVPTEVIYRDLREYIDCSFF